MFRRLYEAVTGKVKDIVRDLERLGYAFRTPPYSLREIPKKPKVRERKSELFSACLVGACEGLTDVLRGGEEYFLPVDPLRRSLL
jgi:hypothetical protein